MKINSYGTIINNIKDIQYSTLDKDFIAFQDEDGAVIQIRISQLIKLHQFYVSSIDSIPRKKTNPVNLDNIFK